MRFFALAQRFFRFVFAFSRERSKKSVFRDKQAGEDDEEEETRKYG
jgi:hypothetical protein